MGGRFGRRLDGSGEVCHRVCGVNNPGKELYERTRAADATQQDWARYYRFVRAVLMRRVGAEYENPGEVIKDRWKAIQFHTNIQFYEDLDDTLEVVMRLYRLLAKHGVITPNYPTDEFRLVRELEEKIPKSTMFRQWWSWR